MTASNYNRSRRHSPAIIAQISAAVGVDVVGWPEDAVKAVKAWQCSKGLVADGMAGPKTLAALLGGGDEARSVPCDLADIRAQWPHAILFTDISRHQTITDYAAFVAASPCVVIKASEGVHYTDPSFATHWKRTKEEGARRAAYHYAHHAWHGKAVGPRRAAEAFCDRLEKDPGELPCVLDLEGETTEAAIKAGMTAELIVDWSMVWCEVTEARTGKRPIIYNNYQTIVRRLASYAIKLQGWPQWMAAYPRDLRWPLDGPVSPHREWSTDAWQFTSSGTCPGVIGNIDLNVALAGGRLAALFGAP